MKKIILSLLLSGISATLSLAQNKLLTVEDAVMKGRTSLAPERLSQLSWIPGSNKLAYIGKQEGKEVIITVEAPAMKYDTILRFDDFYQSYYNGTGDEKKMEKFPQLTWLSPTLIRYSYNSWYHTYDFATKFTKQIIKIPDNAENFDYAPEGNKVAFTVDNNLYYADETSVTDHYDKNQVKKPNADGTVLMLRNTLTTDGSYGTVNGKSVHREEFGIYKGTFWSPKATRLAYYKMYQTMVTDYPLMDLKAKPAVTSPIKYPMAGSQSHHVKVFIYDLIKKRHLEVQTGEPAEQYLTNIAWSPDEEYLFIAVVNRAQNEMKMNMYDGITGAFIKTLFTEKHEKYVEPEKPMVFTKNRPKEFIWMSERDGFNHLYLYNRSGDLLKQLTKGKFAVTEILGFDAKGENLYYMAVSEDGMDKYCWSLELKTGKSFQVTKISGQHQVMINENGYLTDTYSNLNVPRRVSIMDTKGREYGLVLNAIDPIADYKKCNIRLFNIPSTDGTTRLNCRMIMPAGFDSTRKYPVLVYLYGGPHLQLINNNWLGNADMWLYLMAQQGYIVFSLDNRGSINRGLEFENAVFRRLGTVEIEDQLAGASYLKKLAYVDAGRMGVYGWSFGGFMSTNMMTRAAGTFKVGVAGGPVIDWRMYEIMYTERYMDKPDENPEGYKTADLTNYVKNLQGKLLLIHGTSDDVVVWQHTLTYLKKCVDEGVQIDYFVYPGHKHNVLGKDRVHLLQKVTNYFKDNL